MSSGAPTDTGDRGPKFRAVRDAHVKFKRCRRERGQLLIGTGVASILPLVAAFRPDVVPLAVGALAFPAWAGLGLLTAAWALAEWLWYHRMVERADALRRPRR